MFLSSPSLDCRSWKTLVLMSFPYLNGQYLRDLVFEFFLCLIFPGSGAVKFIFSLAISCCIFDASFWWNRCIPMSFPSLEDISTHVQVDVGFAISI